MNHGALPPRAHMGVKIQNISFAITQLTLKRQIQTKQLFITIKVSDRDTNPKQLLVIVNEVSNNIDLL